MEPVVVLVAAAAHTAALVVPHQVAIVAVVVAVGADPEAGTVGPWEKQIRCSTLE